MKKPLKRFRVLFDNRREKDGQITFLLYIANICSLLINIIFGMFFLQVSVPMFIINIFILVFNIFLYFLLKNNKNELFINLFFTQLWIFLISAVLLIGWEYGFQQYLFAMICALFLPFYIPEQTKIKRYKFLGIVFVLTYLILQYICFKFDVGIHKNEVKMQLLHGFNSLLSATIVMMFSALSTLFANETRKKLSRRADFDELTGLYNRYALHQILDNYKNNNDDFYVAIADIDFFKKINDTYGHNVGDQVLIMISKIFKDNVNSNIDVGRWGGEEFLIICNSNITYDNFKKMLENIRIKVKNKKSIILKNEIRITISIGVSKSDKNMDIEKIIGDADVNLYKAKESGRNKLIG